MAALALFGAGFLMWCMWADLQYLVSPRAPLELGVEGDYRFESAQSNRFAQVHGVPSARGWYTREKDGDFVLLAVADTPLVIRRSTFPEEQAGPDGKRPQPLQNPFSARGRLLSRAEAGRYASALTQIEAWSGQPVKWLLLADQRPGADALTLVSFGFLTLFASLNGWLFVQGLRRPRRPG